MRLYDDDGMEITRVCFYFLQSLFVCWFEVEFFSGTGHDGITELFSLV